MTRASARDAAHAALSGRIRIADGCDRTPESVLDELLGELWPDGEPDPLPPPDDGAPGSTPAARSLDGRGKADRLPPPRQAPARTEPARTGPASAAPRRPRPAATGAGAPPGGASAGPSWPPATRRSRRSRPSSGELDEEAFARLLAADPDAAVTLLPDLARATDRELRAAARRLAARVFVRLARSRPASPPGAPAASAPAGPRGISTWTGPSTGGPGSWPPGPTTW